MGIPSFPRKREPSVLASRLVAGTKPLGSRFRGNDGTKAMLPKLQLQLQLQPPLPVPTNQCSPSSSASPPPASPSTATPSAPRSEEHTSELQSLMRISYAVFCLKKTK